MSTANIKLQLHLDISPYTENYHPLSAQLGGNDAIYVLVSSQLPYHGGGDQAQAWAERTYKVLIIIHKQVIREVIIEHLTFEYDYVQPLGEDHLLLVGSRSKYYGRNRFDLNAKVIDLDGNTILTTC